jgi:hypothetical protein
MEVVIGDKPIHVHATSCRREGKDDFVCVDDRWGER